MEMESISTNVSSNTNNSSKRLLFDRRYGWVIDEWKDPSKEALAGGRGMFCILPLASALIEKASQSINFAASSAFKIVENPGEFSPQVMQERLNDGLKKFTSSIQDHNFNPFALKGNSPIPSTSSLDDTPSMVTDSAK